MRRFLLFAGALLLLLVHSLFAQDKTVRGIVKDAKDNAVLPGVTVKVKGASKGTVTKTDGSYELSVPNAGATIVFSFIGYADLEIPVENHSSIDVKMDAGNKNLSEVVVVGYGTQVRRDLTGSVSTISAPDIENYPATSFESALQGKAAGVVIENGSGKLGAAVKIRIRGTSSISAYAQPLYVLDGMPLLNATQSDNSNEPTNPLSDINPNDIESVEVLKDASAAAIYGARASNGVILITTKKGRAVDKTQITLDMNYGISNPTKKRQLLNGPQYVQLMEEAINNGAKAYATDYPAYGDLQYWTNYLQDYIQSDLYDPNAYGTDPLNKPASTNWAGLIFNKNAPSKQVNLSASGGNEKTRFFISGFYTNQDGIVKMNNYERYGTRLSLDHTATDRLSFGINAAINHAALGQVTNDNSLVSPGQMVALAPFVPETDPATGLPVKTANYENALYDNLYNFNKMANFHTIGNAYLNYKFLPSLSFRSEVGTDIYNLTQDEFLGKESQDGQGVGKGTYITEQNVALNTNNYFTFTPNIGTAHKLNAVLGMSYLQNDNKGGLVEGQDYVSDVNPDLSGASTITAGSSTHERYTFLSYFLRANYSYLDKYLLTASIRTDGSSRFGPKNRYGWFPAVSAGWLLSEEDFLKGSSFLNLLKLKASYGVTGGAEIDNYGIATLLQASKYPNFPGYSLYQLGNDSLKWEKTAQFDAGVEFGFFHNRLTGEIDYYNKQTSNLLLNANVPFTSGYITVLKNVGSMENKGVEILLNSRNIDGKDFVWTTSLNLALNKNRVKNVNGQVLTSKSGEQRAMEGQPIGVFYIPKFVGVDPNNGDALYQGADGKPTNDYNSAPYQVVGKGNPDWTGGLTNTFSYKGLDLNVLFTFVTGNSIYNAAGQYQSTGFSQGYDNQTIDMLNRWQKPGDKTNVPRVALYGSNVGTVSSQFLYNGAYIRLKSLSLGYTLPKQLLSAAGISSLRVYVAGYNLWTKSRYISDPEVNTGWLGNNISNIGAGVDYYTMPQARTLTAGLTVKF